MHMDTVRHSRLGNLPCNGIKRPGRWRSFVLCICLTASISVFAAADQPAPKPADTNGTASSLKAKPQRLRAEVKADRVIIYAGERVFTEYQFADDRKYPHFYPVNGPQSGRTVTVRDTEPYPHHSSIFFGCDRVNGGNYWQEGLERGRIVSKAVRLIQEAGANVELEQDCAWERPGAESPFTDHRRIVISAPSADRRYIDFDITLTARTKVKIEKTNHSLFAARMAPDLAVTGGGSLINAAGQKGEVGTFGKASPWADYRGKRGTATEGVTIFCRPDDRWFPSPWFTRDYGFFSPTAMNWLENEGLELTKDETIRLRYRVIIHADDPTATELQGLFEEWSRP